MLIYGAPFFHIANKAGVEGQADPHNESAVSPLQINYTLFLRKIQQLVCANEKISGEESVLLEFLRKKYYNLYLEMKYI